MTKWRTLPALLAATILTTVAACTDDGGSDDDGSNLALDQFPREETLYTTGSAWEPPSDWNPLTSGQVTGLNGLGYETLFHFDPATQELVPWLASSGEWTGDREYLVRLREGIAWSDGEPMTAEDVAYTVELGLIDAVTYANVWNWLDSVEVVDEQTVAFTFSEARHQEWDNFLYTNEILPEHVFSQYSEEEILSVSNEDPVVSGPYTVHSYDQERIAWAKRDDWWATEHLGLEVQPTYIVDLVTPGNAATLNMLIDGEIDLANNFLPGIADMLEGDPELTTYYDRPPYMPSANTTMLIPNTTEKPLDDPAFRRAMAHAISPGEIVDSVYSGTVAAAHPTGLLPIWERYYDQEVLNESGFQFEPSDAVAILRKAGYTDADGDGFVEDLDGEPFAFELIVPTGWTDWEVAARSMARDLRDVGIDVTERFLDAGEVDDARSSGEFDLVLNNWSGITNSPWNHYRYLFQLPIQDEQQTANFGRWENEEAWALTEELAAVSTEDPRYPELIGELERISLEDMPAIPIWSNGAWSQASNAVWTNWPTDDPDTPDAWANFWNEIWVLGTVHSLTELEPVG